MAVKGFLPSGRGCCDRGVRALLRRVLHDSRFRGLGYELRLQYTIEGIA